MHPHRLSPPPCPYSNPKNTATIINPNPPMPPLKLFYPSSLSAASDSSRAPILNQEEETGMDSIPDAIVQHIISQMNDARDIASCGAISKRWRECVPFIPSLFFPRSIFDAVPRSRSDAAITRMVSAAARLEELVIYCPFSGSSLASCLSLRSPTLRSLELRMDLAYEDNTPGDNDTSVRVDCIGLAKNLEVLKLWGVSLTRSPSWGFNRLHTLEIVGAAMRDEAVNEALRACPNLVDLALLACDGVDSISIEMERLEKCRLDLLGLGNGSLQIRSPNIRVLEVQGFGWINVDWNHRLAHLCVHKSSGSVYRVEAGRLPELEFLSVRGIQWCWSAIDSLLRAASEVKHLVMKIEFCGEDDTLQPFPEVDLVDFFNAHPKLKRFEIHGAMFAALCQKNSLKSVDWRFRIPCLEEVLVTCRSALNAEQKLNTLESLVKYSGMLRRLAIRILHMKSYSEGNDDFFEDICKFQFLNNRIVTIE